MDTRLFGGPLAYLKDEFNASAKKAGLASDNTCSSDSSPELDRRRRRAMPGRRRMSLANRLLGKRGKAGGNCWALLLCWLALRDTTIGAAGYAGSMMKYVVGQGPL